MAYAPPPIDDDDDLPVLTQILRTGTTTAATIDREANGERIDGAVATLDEPLLADELVIGSDPDGEAPAIVAETAAADDAFDDGPNAAALAIDVPDFVEHAPPVEPTVLSFVDAPAVARSEPASAFAQPFDGRDIEPLAPAPQAIPESSPVEDPATVALRLRDAVLDDLLVRVGPELDARIAQALHAEVETALGRMQHNLRGHLTDALRDVVARAVAEQMRAAGDAVDRAPAG